MRRIKNYNRDGLPFIAYQGPYGFMIVMAGHGGREQ
jgi:hypothetical protein